MPLMIVGEELIIDVFLSKKLRFSFNRLIDKA